MQGDSKSNRVNLGKIGFGPHTDLEFYICIKAQGPGMLYRGMYGCQWFLAMLVALDFTPVSKSASRTFKLA